MPVPETEPRFSSPLPSHYTVPANICIYSKQGWLVAGHLLLRDSGPYRIIFMNVGQSVVIRVAMALLLRDFGPCRLFMNTCAVIPLPW
jgi:hypothetical protein